MLESLSKTKKLLAYMGILTTSFAVMYTTIFQVINYNIYEAFPNQTMAVNFFISGPYIVTVSYTHLDVYKRQAFKSSTKARPFLMSSTAYSAIFEK